MLNVVLEKKRARVLLRLQTSDQYARVPQWKSSCTRNSAKRLA